MEHCDQSIYLQYQPSKEEKSVDITKSVLLKFEITS